jgi:hypothetical protein
MDLLFKRYASPFSFIDGMMQSGRFDEFVVELVNTVNKEKENESLWEFYLHKVNSETSFKDFVEEVETDNKNQSMTEEDKASTVNMAMDILNNFIPTEGSE